METKKRLKNKGGDGSWRVDGIPTITPGKWLGTQCTVVLSGLNGDKDKSPYHQDAVNGRPLLYPTHSAQIREFKLGTVWKEGNRVYGPPTIYDDAFQVDVSQAINVSLDEPFTLNGKNISTVLPENHYGLCGNRTALKDMRFAVIPVQNRTMAKYLVIPHSEILRFYFGVSSRFISGCLGGTLGKYVNWEKCRIEDGQPVISLKTPLSRKEMAVLARAVSSTHTKEALFGIHKHIQIRHLDNEALNVEDRLPLTIEAGFPFTGQTTLIVAGERMPLWENADKKGEWAVFVMALHHCSHPWGFRSVIAECDELVQGQGDKAIGGQQGQMPLFNPLLDDEEDLDTFETAADPRFRRLVRLTYGNQFDEMPYFRIEYRKNKQVIAATDASGKVVNVPVDGGTYNDASSGADGTGKIGMSDFQSKIVPDRRLTEFIEMIEQLRLLTKNREWKITTKATGTAEISVRKDVLTTFPNSVGKGRSWHLIKEGNTKRPRQVAWVSIQVEEKKIIHLLEMELPPGQSGQCTIIAWMNDLLHMDEITLNTLLKLTAIHHRWPKANTRWEDEKHAESAYNLFKTITMLRTDHLSRSEEESNDDRSKKYVKRWASSILSRLDENFPQYIKLPR